MLQAFRRLDHCWAPAFVMLLALLGFQITSFDLPRTARNVRDKMVDSAPVDFDFLQRASEYDGRMAWATAALVFACVSAWAAWLAWRMLRSFATGLTFRVAVVTTIVLIALELIAGLTRVFPAFIQIHDFTGEVLRELRRPTESESLVSVKHTSYVVNVIAAIVPALVVVAGSICATAELPADPKDVGRLCKDRIDRLNRFMQIGAAMLATGILQMFLWLRLPATMSGIDATTAGAIQSFATAVSLYWGVTYSMVILIWYVPAAEAVVARASSVFAEHPEFAAGEDPKAWLVDFGVTGSIKKQIGQFVTIASPALAGPLAGLVLNWVS